MVITTRHAGPADAAELHELAARTFGLATPPGTLQTDIDAFISQHLSLASFEHYLADPERILLLAEKAREGQSRAVGYSMLVAGPITDPELAAVVAAATAASGSGAAPAAGKAAATGTAIELSKFYVAPDDHGSGVAATLMAATLEAAAKTGAKTCWLGVNQKNMRAARFYAKHGFEIIGTKRFLVGEVWHDDDVRARPL
jgi:ribosomal protein S18 acetylase RimI-like enzyme